MDKTYTLTHPLSGQQVHVIARHDRRLRRHAHWAWQGAGEILLRLPPRMPWREVPRLLVQIEKALARQANPASHRTDEDLARRAREVNRRYFRNEAAWQAIRWVSNMEKRLGSVTIGGSTHGHIRISDKIRAWPDWVVDYVIAHELMHLLMPDAGHSAEFWARLREVYPLTERARGFVQGYYFALGLPNAFPSEDDVL